MHVGVEKSVAQRVAQEGLNEIGRDEVQIVPCGGDGGNVGELDAVHPFHGHAVAARQFPVDGGNAEARIADGVLADLGKGRRLEAQIHLDARRLRQRVDHRDRPEPPHRRHMLFHEPRCGVEGIEIGAETAAHAGPDDLDRHFAPVAPQHRAVDLRDGGGGDRVAESGKDRIAGDAEQFLDPRPGVGGRERLHRVLQALEVDGEFLAHDIGPRGEELPELHPAWPQAVERMAEPLRPALAPGAAPLDPSGKPLQGERASRHSVGGQAGDHAFAGQHPARPCERKQRAGQAHRRRSRVAGRAACIKA